MATGPTTQIADVVVPEVFTPYVQQLTEEKSRIISSGIMTRNGTLDGHLSGGGLTFNVPSFKDLDNDDDRIADDVSHFSMEAAVAGSGTIALDPVPAKIETATEVAVRLSRNKSWSSMDLTADLAGEDPMNAIASRVADYWARRLQAATVATVNGVIADNAANDSGDYANDISGASFVDGVTNFSAEAFIDAAVTMGDSMENITAMIVHSVVYARMQKNNLIDFIPDSNGVVNIPTFLGRQVVVDDGVPSTGSVYDTWLFGAGALQLGASSPKTPTEVERKAGAGNGSGRGNNQQPRRRWFLEPRLRRTETDSFCSPGYSRSVSNRGRLRPPSFLVSHLFLKGHQNG
jgi:hypothetical protein